MVRLINLLVLSSIFFVDTSNSVAQTLSTKLYQNKPVVGERLEQFYPYNGGYVTVSYSLSGPGTLGATMRKINGGGQVDWNVEMDSVYQQYLAPVFTSEGEIFVSGIPYPGPGINVYAFNFMYMDSMFNVSVEKRISVGFPIVSCTFFPDKDGGVIGIVNEACDFSRIMRIDRYGNVLWFRGYQCIIFPPGGTGTTIVNFIQRKNDGNYLMTGHEAYGNGLIYINIDENGDLLSSHFIDVPNATINVENCWDGTNLFQIVQSGYFRKNSTLLKLDSTGMPVGAVRLELRDSIYYTGDLDVLNDQLILSGGVGTNQVASGVYSLDKNSFNLNWGVESQNNNSSNSSFANTHSVVDESGQIAIAYPYGVMTVPGNAYLNTGITLLNESIGAGFCDDYPSDVTISPVTLGLPNKYVNEFGSYTWTEQPYDSDSIPLTIDSPVLLCELELGVENNIGEDLLSVYPNPAADFLFIENSNFESVKMYNLLGEEVLDNKLIGGVNSIDVNGLKEGWYILIVCSETNLIWRKVQIQ